MSGAPVLGAVGTPNPKAEKGAKSSDSSHLKKSSTSSHGLEPPMTSFRPSWSSVSQQLGRSIKSPVHRLRDRLRSQPVDSSIPGIPDQEASQTRGAPASCTVDEILRADAPEANAPKADAPNTDESRLTYPQFDSLEPYCIVNHHELSTRFWREEATRLHYYVHNPNVPIVFKNREYFTTGDEAGYKALSTLVDKILTATSLCILDNECINVQHCTMLSNRSKLQKLIQQAQVAASEGDYDGEPGNHDPRLQDKKHRQEQTALFDLINYVSAVLARLITQTGTGNYWQATVLCSLVKRVVKVKTLLLDLAPNARVAAQNGENVLDRSRDAGFITTTIIDEEEECEEALRIIDADTKDGLTSVAKAQVASYCVNQNKFRSGLNSAFRSILMSLRCLNRSGLPITTYEICSLVYETGFQGFKTLLYQDRDLEYLATSDLDNLNTANSAFDILSRTVEHLKENRPEENRPRDNPSNAVKQSNDVKTVVQWNYNLSDPKDHEAGQDQKRKPIDELPLEYMDEIITVMVPLATANPSLVSELNNFRSIMLLTSDNQELVRPYQETKFTAFFRVYTNTFEASTQSHEILRLKTAFDDGTFERCRLIDPSRSRPSQAKDARSEDAKNAQKFEERARVMEDEWVVDSTCVIVPCPTYVLITFGMATVLASCGLAIGFTVGERIRGVDPFNLATYSWVLAAFIILICKSMLVQNWSWSDFLHLRVRCRSVSELEAVTGIRSQMIITKLLHDDSGGGILVTCGPYNSVFLNRDTEGFSIDQPLTATTMLLSGLTPLKVVTPRGLALACLDARRGTRLRVVGHQANSENEYLVCEDLNRLQKLAREGNNTRPRLQLHLSRELKWKRVLGIYDAGNVVFV